MISVVEVTIPIGQLEESGRERDELKEREGTQ